jgi:hypothetical protein
MTLLDRYLKGEATEVYDELYKSGMEALSPKNFIQTDLILKETFSRVKLNLEIIYAELKNINYRFIADIKYDWQKPILAPDVNVDVLLLELKSKIKNTGYIPLSLEYFYKIVGSCNFCWDWESHPDIPWEGADPIDIPLVKDLIEMIDDDHDSDDILITGDYLQKDNVSGSCYNIELTDSLSIDSVLRGWDIPFIEYMRLTFRNCGFTMADQCDYRSLISFCNKVRPQLLEI